MASLQDITDKIRAAVGADSGLGKSLKFDLKDDGVISDFASQENVAPGADAERHPAKAGAAAEGMRKRK